MDRRQAARRELAKQLTINMLPDVCKEIAEIVGIEATFEICDALGGTPIYLPKSESLLSPILRETVRKEYNGYNRVQLARKYGVSLRTVEIIVQDIGIPEIPGQVHINDLNI